ncbi:MAG: hypothetical protein E6Q24_04780 [Chitinophagaceae bacterium]|nr:MAG: hypothetical protein E6Q24_04780 [Chitinophagaceae bacterium]
MKRYVIHIASAIFTFLFVYTALNKLFELGTFTQVLLKSPLLSEFAPVIAWVIPFAELLTAALLLFPRTLLLGLYAFAGLMLLFSLYIGYMLLFTSHLPCSCGGVLKHLSWREHLVFNICFVVVAVIVIFLEKSNHNQDRRFKLA